jgi:Transglutaminase-like superfamily
MRTDTFTLSISLVLSVAAFAQQPETRLREAFAAAGDNRPALESALERVPADQVDTMRWLIERMPEADLKSLSAEFLLENHTLAYEVWTTSPWNADIDEALFRDAILPYASVNEARDPWRKEFRERFLPRVKDAKTSGQAATILNNTIWRDLSVKYSTARKRPDQSPKESIESGLASCSGLSIVLIAACRAVGVPARFVGTPMWSDGSGNHSWVEVWTDGGWHFTGAAEPKGDVLDKAWFKDRAATAKIGDPTTSIYATTWNDSPTAFPLVWAPRNASVRAIDVTERYVRGVVAVPDGQARVRFRVTLGAKRIVAPVEIVDASGAVVFRGESKDERFDANDHLTAFLPLGGRFNVRVPGAAPVEILVEGDEILVPIPCVDQPTVPTDAGAGVLGSLDEYLGAKGTTSLAQQAWAQQSLTRDAAAAARERIWDVWTREEMARRKEEFDARTITLDGVTMKFWYRTFGEKPAKGRSLWISMHGGGAPPEVNDQQWENQKRLYELEEGVYVAPRAPTDTWNLWHQGHIDPLFRRLIADLIHFEDVDPDRVYIMGYSAGGDGVYQLAPRMADSLAGAGMMAGHPNETRPDGLRNIGFALHMGANDAAYNRNKIAADWGVKLDQLAKDDPGGYAHQVVIHEGKGHWMDRQDRAALPWMAKFTRDPYPKKIVWLQDDVTHARFYWLAVDEPKAGSRIVAERDGQKIVIREATDVGAIRIRLNDEFIDLSQEITVERDGAVVFNGKVDRTIATIVKTLEERGDPRGIFTAEIVAPAPAAK